MAERVGFEPTVPITRDTRSPGAPVRPLQHLSNDMHDLRGGEGGIRTREPQRSYRFSRTAPSTTRPPLQAWLIIAWTWAISSLLQGLPSPTSHHPPTPPKIYPWLHQSKTAPTTLQGRLMEHTIVLLNSLRKSTVSLRNSDLFPISTTVPCLY